MPERLLTVAEVADHIRVHPATVREWLRKGRLKGSILGDKAGWRIPESEVERFLKETQKAS